jgi:hypothetical protein
LAVPFGPDPNGKTWEKSVTHVLGHLLPMSPVYTAKEGSFWRPVAAPYWAKW